MTEQTPPIEDSTPRTRNIRRADLVVSPIMIVGGLWFAYDSIRISIETISAGHATIETSPGLFPLIISTLIVVTSIWVFVHALRSGARYDFLRPVAVKAWASNRENWTPLIVMAFFVLYVFVLIGRIPFEFATAAFGVAMMATFKATKWRWIIVINAAYAAFVIYAFSNFAYTQFPLTFF